MVDLVGIEPTTSSMPCCSRGGRSLVFNHLRTGKTGGNGMFGAIPGQFPAKKFKTKGYGLHGRGFKQFHPHISFVITKRNSGSQYSTLMRY